MRRRVIWSSLCLLTLTLAGCASGGSTTALEPMAAPLGSNYRTIVVSVASSVPDSDADARALENEIITELRKNPRLASVVSATGSPDAKADLRLDANIVNLRKVSPGKRVMLGALAGRGSVTVDVNLVDGTSRRNLAAFTSEGKTSGGTVFAGTTEQALQRAAEEIAGFVSQSLGS
ncbi:MAG: DUF4410 domain-containing protein [Thermoanaerobaculia bacterium]